MATPDAQNMHNYLAGVSFISLVAPNEDLFYETITYYTDLGFVETLVYDRSNQALSGQHDLCFLSDKETWLHSDSEYEGQGTAITIKVRLVTSSKAQEHDPDHKVLQDWRGAKQALVLFSPNLGDIIALLKEKNYAYQMQPNENAPCEVYTYDPLSTLVGFTSKANPFTTVAAPLPAAAVEKKKARKVDPAPDSGKPKRKIAVMTSGGDSPGMNGAVRAVVRSTIALGHEAYCIYEGYEGLVKGGDLIKRMAWEDVRGWLSEGGTLIGTARCAEFRERPGRLAAAKNLVLNGIDGLIVCGGDGSLTGADLFRQEWTGLLEELVETEELTPDQVAPFKTLNIAGLVGSIDNDMSSTDATIGAYSSLARICQAVDYIDMTAASHQRAFVIEVMGRHCGWLAVMSGVSTGADYIFIPEKPPPEGWETQMCDTISRHRKLGKRKTIVIVAEGAIDRNLNAITSNYVMEVLVKRLKLDTRVTCLGHVQRGGTAVAYDRMLSTLQGVEAVKAIVKAKPEDPSPMIAITENKITRKPLVEAVEMTKGVARAIKSKDFAQAMHLRDAEFDEYYRAFIATTVTGKETDKLPESERKRYAIIHIGAPAGGMNAATRAAALYCISRGHRAFAIHNGFTGLVRHNSVRELTWLGVEGWAIRGGSEIGTNRTEPNVDMGMVAWYFQKYQFDGLLIIGGFEAFKSLSELRKARAAYPAFRIPMVCLPATISNNVPGTEYSIGSDTCLNALIDYCDAIKQSASASRRRVFVVECQGGRSGYVATMAGLSTGALAVYTPEEGIKLEVLMNDINKLRDSFASDQGMNRAGKLILRNERASATYTTEIIGNMIREEAQGRFESRTSIPGHVQQGGTPSPMDRVRAVRLATRCIHFLEEHGGSKDEVHSNKLSAAVIGIKGAAVVFSPMETLESTDTDWQNRRPLAGYWRNLRGIVDVLSGRKDSFSDADMSDEVEEKATAKVAGKEPLPATTAATTS
ncbi:6-phosphofructokinase, alpha subunit [Orbilia brochopaga]|uniref:ATP-dependent 6-phosphofructokinase n=1 Tax=Orbilia brochopaga TaxID=3140254 RepID=A0AAV9UHV8_9PEZI